MFNFKSKRGSMNAGMGGGIGGVCLIGLIVFIIAIWPSISGVVNEGQNKGKEITDKMFGFVEGVNNDNKNSEDNSDDKNSNDNNDFLVPEDVTSIVNKIRVAEEDKSNDTPRSDWETSKKFTCPVSGKKTTIKNYAYEMETNLAYNRDDFSYICPYSHEEVTDVTKIDYDHIIPINYVDSHGGSSWAKEQKQEYAYNIDNGICTWQKPNRVKGDKGPSEYMPDYNKEWYCYKWADIAVKYDISISQADYDVIVKTLNIN